MSLRVSPPLQAFLFVAFLLAWGGVVGDLHQKRMANIKWWEGTGSRVLNGYVESAHRSRLGDPNLTVSAMEAKALTAARTGVKGRLDAKAEERLGETALEKVRDFLTHGEKYERAEEIETMVLKLRFYRGDYEGVAKAVAENPTEDARSRLVLAAAANWALYQRTGDETRARAALGNLERWQEAEAPGVHFYVIANQCWILRELGESEEAESRLRGYLALMGESRDGAAALSEARIALTRFLTAEARTDEALAACRETFAFVLSRWWKHPKRDELVLATIECWRKLGKSDEGIRSLILGIASKTPALGDELEPSLALWLPEPNPVMAEDPAPPVSGGR